MTPRIPIAATLAELADIDGVSVSTVSRAFALAGNPAECPIQPYNWLVLSDLCILSFVYRPGLSK